MSTRRTHEDFIEEVKKLSEDTFIVLSEYVHSQEPIKMKHKECEHEWITKSSNILRSAKKRKCPICAVIKTKKTHEEFAIEIYNVYGDVVELLEKYTNMNTKIKVKNTKCLHEYVVLPSTLIRGHGCMECSGSRKKTQEEFLEEIKKKYGDKISILGVYINSKTKLEIINNDCGHTYSITPTSLLFGKTGCKTCYHTGKRKTKDAYEKELYGMVGDEFSLVGEYTTSKEKIIIKHNSCNYEYETTPIQFARLLSKCPNCYPSYSRGEQRISDILTLMTLNFTTEKRFDDCRNKNPLPFDFYIENKLIVEFDGEQHFKTVSFGEKDEKKTLRRLKVTQKNDSIKNLYCIINNIPLIRIPYWEFDNIEKIIISTLVNYNIISNDLSVQRDYMSFSVDENWNQKEYLNKHLSLGA